MIKKIALFLALSCFTINAFAAITELDDIAAVVNNSVITLSELNARATQVTHELEAQKIKVPPRDVLTNQVLQMLINEALAKQTAQRANITATTQDVQHAIQNVAAQQKMTPAQFRESLKRQGVSETAFLAQIKQQIIMQKLLREMLASQITVTPQEVEAGMKMAESQAGSNNEYHLLHIVIPLPDSPTPAQINAAKAKADGIIISLNTGESFKTLAAAQSSGAQMFNGGDMGWKTLAQLPTVFADKVMDMKSGSVAGPIQTANGFHILKLVAMRGKALNTDQAKLKQQIQQMIFQRKLQEKQQDWISQLRSSAYIKIDYHPTALPTPNLS